MCLKVVLGLLKAENIVRTFLSCTHLSTINHTVTLVHFLTRNQPIENFKGSSLFINKLRNILVLSISVPQFAV